MATGLAILVVGLMAAQQVQQHKAAKQQRRIREEQKRAADVRAQRERIQQIRRARIARAQTEQAAINTGAQFSSGLEGSQSSTMSQLGANLSYINETQRIQNRIYLFQNRADRATKRAADYGTLAKLGGMAFSQFASTSDVPLKDVTGQGVSGGNVKVTNASYNG